VRNTFAAGAANASCAVTAILALAHSANGVDAVPIMSEWMKLLLAALIVAVGVTQLVRKQPLR
jgi:arginine exporter protein ArgO